MPAPAAVRSASAGRGDGGYAPPPSGSLPSLSSIVAARILQRTYYSIDIFQTAWKFLLQKQEQGNGLCAWTIPRSWTGHIRRQRGFWRERTGSVERRARDGLLRLRAAACHKGIDEVLPQPRRPQGSRNRRSYRRDRGGDRSERVGQEHLLQPGERLSSGGPRRGAVRRQRPSRAVRRPRSRTSALPAPFRARGSFPR